MSATKLVKIGTTIATAAISLVLVFSSAMLLFEIHQETLSNAAYKTLDSRIQVVEEDAANTAYAPTIDWTYLSSINADVIGWISVPGASINFPVVQPRKDMPADYYLKHDFWNNYSKLGCPYLDKRCMPEDKNQLIFGHHLASNKMFSKLGDTYLTDNFSLVSKGIYITKMWGSYQLEPLISLSVDMHNQDVQKMGFIDREELEGWLLNLKDAIYPKAYVANFYELCSTAESVVSLVTCKSAFSELDKRTVVIFKATKI